MTEVHAARTWREAAALYGHSRVVAMLFLGFSAGLPFLLVFATLTAWLTQAGVSRGAIGFFSWIGITYSIKVFWAPVVDRLALPGLTTWLGRRRGWILLAQFGIALGLIGMAHTDPATQLTQVALYGLLVAFSSATQDIAIDAWRIESAPPELQGAMAATYQMGYRIALLAAGAGALFIAASYSWPAAYLAMAALVGVGVATVLLVAEPERSGQVAAEREAAALLGLAAAPRSSLPRRCVTWFTAAVVMPFVDFFKRNGRHGLWVLLFIALFRLTDITMGVMANPFYLDIGFTLEQIASVAKVFGVLMTIVGAVLGGLIVARFGVVRTLVLGGLLVIASNLLFAALAQSTPNLAWLALVIGADNLAAGIAGSAFIAYLSGLTNIAYTATQYALFSSLMTLPGKFLGGFSGKMVEAVGYPWFFIYTSALGIPALLLALYFLRRARSGAAQPG
ncbi:MAG: MFS transporter [Thiotrichales bacterium]